MKFLELHERLRLETWRRIDQGVSSSSLLAQKTGLAQAHISNFLHRRRRLSLTALDRILFAQALSVEDLASPGIAEFAPPEGKNLPTMDIVPIVSQATAMGAPLISARAVIDFIQLPSGWLAGLPTRRALSRRTWERFVAVRVTHAQARPVDPLLRAGSIVILDRHFNSRAPCKPPHPNLYAVRSGSQLLFRHVDFESGHLILRPRVLAYPVELIEVKPAENPADFLVGRVCLCISEL